MRVNSKGYIECRSLSVKVPHDVLLRGQRVGHTRIGGMIREVEEFLGVEVEDVKRALGRNTLHDCSYEIILDSDWTRPSRR